ncbi:MAG: hypothetical protein H6707_12520 [Deltaproteobacteria bacterium]|nr:hypothetical protein [Deltaproteobacteria bacterium]
MVRSTAPLASLSTAERSGRGQRSDRLPIARPARGLVLALVVAGACDGRPQATPRPACASCHAIDRQRASLPDHNAAGFPSDCGNCHSEDSWKPARNFDHPGELPLVGKHGELTCGSCHDKEPLPRSCVGCHEADRGKAKEPDHLAKGFLIECETCHVPRGWTPAVDHRKFPLTGQHLRLDCESCHDDPPVPSACVDCHEADRAKAKDPDHRQTGYPTTCENCHLPKGWTFTRFNHSPAFPLSGAHAPLSCRDCHHQRPLPKTCLGCHEADRARAVDPDHLAADFSTDCAKCHGTEAWLPAIDD